MLKQGLKMGARALSTYLIVLVLCLLLCAQIGPDWYWAQVVLNLAMLIGMGFMMFSDGGYRGERACTMTATVDRLREEGRQPGAEMLSGRFAPKAALVAFLTCALPLLLVAGVNLAAEPFYPPVILEESSLSMEQLSEQYAQMNEEERAALEAEAAATPTNWVNVAARAVYMPFVFAYLPFGQNPHGLNLMFFAFAVLSALPEPIGYLCGPQLRKKKLMDIEKGKKRKLKKLKVNQKPREPKKPKMEV